MPSIRVNKHGDGVKYRVRSLGGGKISCRLPTDPLFLYHGVNRWKKKFVQNKPAD